MKNITVNYTTEHFGPGGKRERIFVLVSVVTRPGQAVVFSCVSKSVRIVPEHQ